MADVSVAAEPQPDRPDVFVSYSRRDGAIVRELVAALASRGKDAWADLEDIPPTAEWMEEIEGGIDLSGAFAYELAHERVAQPFSREERIRYLNGQP